MYPVKKFNWLSLKQHKSWKITKILPKPLKNVLMIIFTQKLDYQRVIYKKILNGFIGNFFLIYEFYK